MSKDLRLCSTCIQHIYDLYDEFSSMLDNELKEKYNIHMPRKFKIPVTDCNCTYNNALIFDYFTTLGDEEYHLVLCGICRSCNGYKRIELEEIKFPIHLKDAPKHIGISIIDLNDEDVTYIR